MNLKELEKEYRMYNGSVCNDSHKREFSFQNFESLLSYALDLESELEDLSY